MPNELNVFWPKPMDEEAEHKARLNVDLVWDVTTQEDFPQSVAIHQKSGQQLCRIWYSGAMNPR